MLEYKRECEAEKKIKDLGEEICTKDERPLKVKYKAQSDDGKRKLHPARWNRPPLAHPKNYYHLIPTKHEVIIRNFPNDHLGINGQVPEGVIGKMHNRTVKVTFDQFCKTSQREARGPHKGGKYASPHQLRDGLTNYCLTLHSLWNSDYSGLVMQKVLGEAEWAENIISDDKKRAEVITDFINSVIADNCGKAVHESYPLVYEQVRAKWVRHLENAGIHSNRFSGASAPSSQSQQISHNSGRGRGRGGASGGYARGGGAPTGNRGGRGGRGGGAPRGNRVNPRPPIPTTQVSQVLGKLSIL